LALIPALTVSCPIKKWSAAAALAATAFIFCCPAPRSRRNPNSVHDDFTARWIGKPFDDFTIRYGIGSAAQKLKDGRSVVEWSEGYGVSNTGLLLSAPLPQLECGNARRVFSIALPIALVVDTAGRIEMGELTLR
jgi:hypothetical protein